MADLRGKKKHGSEICEMGEEATVEHSPRFITPVDAQTTSSMRGHVSRVLCEVSPRTRYARENQDAITATRHQIKAGWLPFRFDGNKKTKPT